MTIRIGDRYKSYLKKIIAFIRRRDVAIIIKYAVVSACFFILFNRLNESDFQPEIYSREDHHSYWFLLFIVLSVLNFTIDVYLWASISKGTHRLRFSHYARHHLISMSMGFITPNNIGEYGGKLRQFDAPISKVKGVLLAFHFRTVKTVARNILGFIAVLWLYTYQENFFLKGWHIFIFLTVVSFHFLFYWNIESFLPLISNISIQGKNYFQPLLRIRVSDIQKVFWIGLSALKFTVYTLQLTLLILAVLPENYSFIELWSYVAFYYSLASYLPTILIFDPIVKGAVGILLLKDLNLSDWTILTSITMVWAANVALPSVLGSLLWVRRNQ